MEARPKSAKQLSSFSASAQPGLKLNQAHSEIGSLRCLEAWMKIDLEGDDQKQQQEICIL